MNGQKHIINREILELKVPDREIALPIQNKAAEIIKYRLNPALDELFSKISNKDEVVSINRLVIDVGTLSTDKIDEDFIQLAIKNAEEELSRILFKIRKTGVKGGSAKSTNGTEQVTLKSRKANYLDQFIHFLKTGNLSWWKTSEATDYQDKLFEEIVALDKTLVMQQVLPLLKVSSIRKRFVYQFTNEQLVQFVEFTGVKAPKELFNITSEIGRMVGDQGKFSEIFRTEFWLKLFSLITEKKQLETNIQILEFLYSVLSSSLEKQSVSQKKFALTSILTIFWPSTEKVTSETNLLLLAAVISYSENRGVTSKKIIEFIQSPEFKKPSKKIKQLLVELNKRIQTDKNEDRISSKGFIKKGTKEEMPEIKLDAKQRDQDRFAENQVLQGEEIAIANAGLVILYPFLKHFFDGLGLLNKQLHFKSPDHSFKAVHLLQFIATQSKVNPEFELSLNKILCGLEIWDPIPQKVNFLKSELKECENLLKTVLERWAVLKTNKTEALRETFINREGKLVFENNGWNLNVERNSFDVLIDKLPWGISIIKLPWSSQIIHVEW